MPKFLDLKRLIGAWAVCGSILAYAATPAEAAFVLRIDDLSTAGVDVTLVDPTGPPYNVLSFTGVVGVFPVNITSGVDLNPPDPLADAIDIVSLNIAGTAGHLRIQLSGTGFDDALTLPGVLAWSWGGTVNGGPNGSVSGFGCKAPSNVLFACSPINTGLLGPFGFPSFATAGSTPHAALVSPYSMFIQIDYVTTGSSDYSGNFRLQNTAIPEPGSIALLGTGLVGAARAIRRRRNRKSEV